MQVVEFTRGRRVIAEEMDSLRGEPFQSRPVEVALAITAEVKIDQLITSVQARLTAKLSPASRPCLTTMPTLIIGDSQDMRMAGSIRNVAVAWR